LEELAEVADNPDKPIEVPVSEVIIPRQRFRGDTPGPGRPAFDQATLQEFDLGTLEQKKAKVDQKWAAAAYILAERARRFGLTVTKADFGRLQQLVTSAGIARDKIWAKPEAETPAIQNNFLVALFGSIGMDTMLSTVMNKTPDLGEVIEATAVEVKEA